MTTTVSNTAVATVAFAAAIFAASCRATGPARTPAADAPTRALMHAWSTGDTSNLASFLHEDVVYDDVANGLRYEGVEAIAGYVRHVRSWAPDARLTIDRMQATHRGAFVEWTFEGVQDRPIPGRVVVATGRPFTIRGATVVEVDGGRIRRAADYLDVASFAVQLGGRLELPGGVVVGGPPPPADAPVATEDARTDSSASGATTAAAHLDPPPGMRAYQLGLIRRGPTWTPERTPELEALQAAHLANIERLAATGELVLAGPCTDDGDLRGLFVFAAPDLEKARELCDTDPAVQAGRLVVELHPWWGAAALADLFREDTTPDEGGE